MVKNGLQTLTVFIEPAYLRGHVVFKWDKVILEELIDRIEALVSEVKAAKLQDIIYICSVDPWNEIRPLSFGCTLRLLTRIID